MKVWRVQNEKVNDIRNAKSDDSPRRIKCGGEMKKYI